MIRIDILKESTYADFKYTSFIKMCLIFEKRGKTPPKIHRILIVSHHQIQCIRTSTVQVSSSYLQKCGILLFLPEKIMDACLFVLFFLFFSGVIVDPMVQEYRDMAHWTEN